MSLEDIIKTIQKMKETAKILCYQCEKCGFIDADSKEEFEAMPKEHQQYLSRHIRDCGGRFLPFKVVPLKDLENLELMLCNLQKQLQTKEVES